MKKLWMKIKLLFTKAGKIVEKAVTPAIKVVNILKDAVENPAMNVIVSLTPFNWDDEAFKLAKQLLPKALIELEIIKGLEGKTNDEIVTTIVNEVRQYTNEKKAGFYEDLAVMLSHFLSDGKISADELSQLVAYIYQSKFQNK